MAESIENFLYKTKFANWKYIPALGVGATALLT
jgi:hypothetical protein